MKRKIEKNMWCDSMCCEKNIAWMVGSEINALFQLDFNTKSYHFITDFPNTSINNIRQNQLCLKIGNDIYFFPDRGKSVGIYNLLNKNFKEILINNPDNERIMINMVFYCMDKLYAVSIGFKGIIEIDIYKEEIVNIYLFANYMQDSEISSEGCIVDDKIYFTIPEKNMICEFSSGSKKITAFCLSEKIMPQTICYDGENFIISGRIKKIIKWDIKNNRVLSFADMPKTVALYEYKNHCFFEDQEAAVFEKPLYRWSVKIKDYIWLIPFTSNRVIYYNMKTSKVYDFDIESEREDKESWQRQEQVKYRLECIFEDRYIFLYSYKNRRYLVIDTQLHRYEEVDIVLYKNDLREFMGSLYKKCESVIESDSKDVLDLLYFPCERRNCADINNGAKIYSKLIEGLL